MCPSCSQPLREVGARCTKCSPERAPLSSDLAPARGSFGSTLQRLDADRVTRSRRILLVITALAAVSTFVSYLHATGPRALPAAKLALAIDASLCLFYFAMWLWSKKSVLKPAVFALIAFCTVILLTALVYPPSLFSGILLKALIILSLIGAIREARIAQAHTKQQATL